LPTHIWRVSFRYESTYSNRSKHLPRQARDSGYPCVGIHDPRRSQWRRLGRNRAGGLSEHHSTGCGSGP
jgi:hypothetical protein